MTPKLFALCNELAPVRRLTIATASLMITCSGHILLALADDESRQETLDNIPADHGEPTVLAVGDIVSRIRDAAFESVSSAQVQRMQDIGYPVVSAISSYSNCTYGTRLHM